MKLTRKGGSEFPLCTLGDHKAKGHAPSQLDEFQPCQFGSYDDYWRFSNDT